MMMPRQKIGELLRRNVPLTAHDIDEILHEQVHTRKRFGDVAMSLGMVRPQDVWRAWCEQIKDSIEHVDLDQLGIDGQATQHLPADLARELGAIPVRLTDTHLVIATSDESFEQATARIPEQLQRRIKFVIAPAGQVSAAIEKYYR